MRRWMTRHVPVVVHRNDYPEVLDDVQGALNAGGVHVKRGRVEGLLRVPTSVLAFAAGGGIRALRAETARLFSTRVEILLYPFDLVISGEPAQVSHAQAIAAEQLPRTKAYMTWSEQGDALEDRLKHLWTRLRGDSRVTRHDEVGEVEEAMAEVEGIGRDLRSTFVSYEEWEVLMREMLMAERDLLRRLIERERPRRSRQAREAIRGA